MVNTGGRLLSLLAAYFFMQWYYRLEYYRLLTEISPELESLSLAAYLGISLLPDGLATLLLLIIPLGLLILSGRYRKTSLGLFLLYTFIVTFIYALAFGFFRVYETNFRPSAVRDISSLLSELLISIAAEFNDRAVNFVLITNLAAAAGWFLGAHLVPRRHYLLFLLLPAGFWLIGYFQAPGLPNTYKAVPGVTLESIQQNPLLTLLQAPTVQQRASQTVTQTRENFPTLSLTSQKVYPPLKLPRKKYNVVLYFFESTAAKWLSYRHHGKEVTPAWNQLRQNALYFERHYANFPLSINGFFNVFCSLYALPDGRWLSLEKPDFPLKCASELLHEAGYRNAVMHASDPDYAGQRKFYKNRNFSIILDNHDLKKPPWQEGLGPWGAADERALIEPAIRFAKKYPENFFITLFAFNPHHPYFYGKQHEPLVKEIPSTLHWKERNRLNYINSLHFADRAMGELIQRFEAEGLADNTIFIIVADHGEAFYEHPGNYNHPHYIYEENIRVPFLIYNRRLFPTGRSSSQLSSHIDILPTLLDLLGLPPAEHAMGHSLLRGGRERLVDLQAFWDIEWNGIRDDRFKYLIRPQDNREEFYDLENDPEEKHNVLEHYRELATQYRNLTEISKAYKLQFYHKLFGYRPHHSGRPSDYDRNITP